AARPAAASDADLRVDDDERLQRGVILDFAAIAQRGEAAYARAVADPAARADAHPDAEEVPRADLRGCAVRGRHGHASRLAEDVGVADLDGSALGGSHGDVGVEHVV